MSYETCAHCGRRFDPFMENRQKYNKMYFCSDSCRDAYLSEQERAEEQAAAEREHAKAVREQAWQAERQADAINRANQIEREKLAFEKSKIPCAWCGTKFIPSEGFLRGIHIFCSRKCVQEFSATPEGKSTLQKTVSGDELYAIGENYYYGKNGMEENYYMAALYYNAAAEKGNTKAINFVGYLYDQGKGVPQDKKRAFSLFVKAAELGNVSAMRNTALYYENGSGGVSKDMEKALSWYAKAAEKESDKAIYALGRFYEEGLGGLEANKEKAVELYTKAAILGNSDAQSALERIEEAEVAQKEAEEKEKRIALRKEQERKESLVRGKSSSACVFHWLFFLILLGFVIIFCFFLKNEAQDTSENCAGGFLHSLEGFFYVMLLNVPYTICYYFSMTHIVKDKIYKKMFSWPHFVKWFIMAGIIWGIGIVWGA